MSAAATDRVNAALDRGERPAYDDLMVCDVAALVRAQMVERDADPLAAADVDAALPMMRRPVASPPTPCPRCHGRGYFTEDPAPDCPSVAYVGTEIECRACDGSGEVQT